MIKRFYIEITNRCNLKCSFCKDTNKEKKDMSLQDFKYILNQINPICNYIYLHIHGEPLLHNEFNEILNLCDKYNMHIQLVSNGTLLNKYPDILNHKSIRRLSISFQSIEYSNVDINELMNTTFKLIDEVKNKDNQYIQLRFWRSDQYNLDKTSLALKLICEHFNIDNINNIKDKLTNNTYISMNNMFDWPDINDEKEDEGTCLGSINQFGILVDGTVVPCCLDVNGDINLGNIFESNLVDIINSQRVKDMQESFRNNKLIEDLCKSCRYRKRFK